MTRMYLLRSKVVGSVEIPREESDWLLHLFYLAFLVDCIEVLCQHRADRGVARIRV